MENKEGLVLGLCGCLVSGWLVNELISYLNSGDPLVFKVLGGIVGFLVVGITGFLSVVCLIAWWEDNDYGRKLRLKIKGAYGYLPRYYIREIKQIGQNKYEVKVYVEKKEKKIKIWHSVTNPNPVKPDGSIDKYFVEKVENKLVTGDEFDGSWRKTQNPSTTYAVSSGSSSTPTGTSLRNVYVSGMTYAPTVYSIEPEKDKLDLILEKLEKIEKVICFKRPCKECMFDHVQWEKNLFEFIQICLNCPRRKRAEGSGENG
ncbi:hypothetical protein DRP04_05910 [Archaeoglobales archaeon]|nr:MAG: hypothetical protein DRP04_05910 [Archaeoglobales archaeon]